MNPVHKLRYNRNKCLICDVKLLDKVKNWAIYCKHCFFIQMSKGCQIKDDYKKIDKE